MLTSPVTTLKKVWTSTQIFRKSIIQNVLAAILIMLRLRLDVGLHTTDAVDSSVGQHLINHQCSIWTYSTELMFTNFYRCWILGYNSEPMTSLLLRVLKTVILGITNTVSNVSFLCLGQPWNRASLIAWAVTLEVLDSNDDSFSVLLLVNTVVHGYFIVNQPVTSLQSFGRITFL